jgi:DeoR/GlpR family transcriptional regulator of sugar metabolism
MPKTIGDIRLYSVQELSEILEIQETTIRRYLRDKKLIGRKLARRWYVSEESLADYFRQYESEPEKDS